MNERDNPSMKYYLAPMEGLTGYIYRNAYHACYHAMDKYFTPFLSPKANSKLSFRELNDILPEHNQVCTLSRRYSQIRQGILYRQQRNYRSTDILR